MKKVVLGNGVRVLLKQKRGESVTVQVAMNVGSVDEYEDEKGFSHLIEHMLFEGTQKRPSAKIIAGEIENVGGELNAATSNEQTNYYVKVAKKHVSLAIDVLSDMILYSTFEEEKIEKEKRIVLEEIKMITDQPRYFQWIFFEKHLFDGTEYAIPVYGNSEIVAKADRVSLLNYFNRTYKPKNCVVTVVGNFDENHVLADITAAFSKWTSNSTYKRDKIVPINIQRFELEKKDIQQVYSILGYTTVTLNIMDAPIIEVIESILGKPQSGRLNDKIRNNYGYAYDIGINYECFHGFGFIAINVGCKEEFADKVQSIITEELESLKQDEVLEEELSYAKQYIEGKLLLELEDSHKDAENITNWEFITGEDRTMSHLDAIKQVSAKDILRVANELFSKDRTEIRILPK